MAAPKIHPGAPLRSRMLKAQCGRCAYTVRLSRKWISDVGPPLCPSPGCDAAPLELPEWDPMAERNDAGNGDAASDHRMIRDAWVVTRAWHPCSACGADHEPGEHMRYRTYTVSGEFISSYTCQACDGFGPEAARAHAAEQSSTASYGRAARG